MINSKRLSMHHIGGRGGGRAFPILKKFEKDIVNILYEADPDCLAQVQERNKNLESELHVLPYCLADACKSTSFNINYDPYTSSLLDPNPDYKSYYYFCDDHDYLWSEATKAMEKRHIEVVTIDHIFQSTNIQIPPPDFLSIDTQGSEYDILLGAKETLKSSVLALIIEAEFHQIYKNQKLFGDLVKLLSDQGFHFVRCLDLYEMSPFRASVGTRGEGFHMFTEALFFRRIDDIDNDEDEFRRYIMLRKLAFIAIVFNQFEYGLECLRRSKNHVGYDSTTQEELPAYYRFLRDLEESIERMPAVYPNTFTSKYTFEASKARFESSANLIRKGMKNIIKQKLWFLIPTRFKRALRWIKHILFFLSFMDEEGIFIKSKLFTRCTDVEAILLKYGLEPQANILKQRRLIQTHHISRGYKDGL